MLPSVVLSCLALLSAFSPFLPTYAHTRRHHQLSAKGYGHTFAGQSTTIWERLGIPESCMATGGVAPALYARDRSLPYTHFEGNLALAWDLYSTVWWAEQLPRALAVKAGFDVLTALGSSQNQ